MDGVCAQDFEDGNFYKVLVSSTVQALLGHNDDIPVISLHSREDDWEDFVFCRVNYLLEEIRVPDIRSDLFLAGCAALHALLQSNVTGPPLPWSPPTTIIPQKLRDEVDPRTHLRRQLISSLTIDGETIYALTPNVELFCLAKCLLNHAAIIDEDDAVHIRFRLRVNFWHQRMLSEVSPTLQGQIYRDLEILEREIPLEDHPRRAEFLIERATIHTQHGFDEKARADLADAANERNFDYALTGRLGKRTKFQEQELSQLVVLAKSSNVNTAISISDVKPLDGLSEDGQERDVSSAPKPKDLELNDDTLLEAISFSKAKSTSRIQDQESLPRSLQALDPSNQPILEPLDSIILLAIASSITNTSPQDGLTREETLPYATRVLNGSSTNWQIYTQALLVRSRIEGYRSRTIERGLLQLQAIVDQVIAETTSSDTASNTGKAGQDAREPATASFLPQAKPSESASVKERLRYIHLLSSPTRWKLELELADRWVTLGGLRSALEIYERLQMWAEVALCWAAQDREDEARKVVRGQLYTPAATTAASSTVILKPGEGNPAGDANTKEQEPLPNDAPRLFCILGDLERSVAAYERAWEVSNYRYARAQRSIGRYHFQNGDLQRANEAYTKSLRINPQNHSIWFALGCVRLQLEDWAAAVDAFARAVQIEEQDAESWSNLAAALLRLPTNNLSSQPGATHAKRMRPDEDATTTDPPELDTQKHTREAFVALKRAAILKRESYRIWQNLLQVAIQLSPPPYADIIIAQNRLIELLGPTQGEKCIDIPVVEGLVHYLISAPASNVGSQTASKDNVQDQPQKKRSGYEKMVIDLVQKNVVPLITSSRRLWLITAKLSLYLQRPSAALAAYEKAWRVTTNQPGWDSGTAETEKLWKEVAEATSDLADAYESLGERTRESGLGEGEVVAKDWRFKARSAIRAIIGRAREGWEGSSEFTMLREKLDDVKTS